MLKAIKNLLLEIIHHLGLRLILFYEEHVDIQNSNYLKQQEYFKEVFSKYGYFKKDIQ